jgi:hypothetical protein
MLRFIGDVSPRLARAKVHENLSEWKAPFKPVQFPAVPTPATVFLLSPAYCGGRRATMLMRPEAAFPLAQQLRAGSLGVGPAFAFMSGLYFRGKLAYAARFGRSGSRWVEPTLVITPTRGLQAPDWAVTLDVLREFADGEVSVSNRGYRSALERDVATLAMQLGKKSRVVLLGSVATGKYVDILLPLLGDRLCYPSSFIGRGDMSRGGLMLRSAASGEELDYIPLQAGVRPRGPRPPKLDPATRVPLTR